jgi:phage-related tail protein
VSVPLSILELTRLLLTFVNLSSIVSTCRTQAHFASTKKTDELLLQLTTLEEKVATAEARLGRQKARHDGEIAALEKKVEEAAAVKVVEAGEGDAGKIADLEEHVQRECLLR